MALKRSDPRMVDYIYKFGILTLAPFVPCACGEEINSQVEKLHESSYMNKWYEEKPATRKYQLTFSTVAIKPKTFQYKKFITFNLACYAGVIKGMYSYVTMLSNFITAD